MLLDEKQKKLFVLSPHPSGLDRKCLSMGGMGQERVTSLDSFTGTTFSRRFTCAGRAFVLRGGAHACDGVTSVCVQVSCSGIGKGST